MLWGSQFYLQEQQQLNTSVLRNNVWGEKWHNYTQMNCLKNGQHPSTKVEISGNPENPGMIHCEHQLRSADYLYQKELYKHVPLKKN